MADRARFKINVANALSIESDAVRAKLLSLALSKPENYYKLRDSAINSVTRNMASKIYDIYWDILTDGVVEKDDPAQAAAPANGLKALPGARGATHFQLCFPDVANSPYANVDFQPKLPERAVNIKCSEIAETIKGIAHEIIELIMPMDHLKMAQEKSIDLLRVRGQ